MQKEQRWKFTYRKKDGTVKSCYPRSEEKVEENRQKCAELGMEVIGVQKLYPFSTMKNQHNFELIRNICFNEIHDMDHGEKPMDEEAYEQMSRWKDLADEFFCLPLPVAWLPWEQWKDAKELSEMAIIHRQNACIANGRPDLVTYC